MPQVLSDNFQFLDFDKSFPEPPDALAYTIQKMIPNLPASLPKTLLTSKNTLNAPTASGNQLMRHQSELASPFVT